MTDDWLDRVDEWCDSIYDSHDPGFASVGRDLLDEATEALRVAGVVPAEPATHDTPVWLVEDASGTPGYHSVSDGTFHVLAPTSIAQLVSDLLNAGARAAVAGVGGEAPA